MRWRGEFDKVGKTRVTPLTTRAIETMRRALAHRREDGLQESPWLIPAGDDPTKAVPRTRLDNFMRRTKREQLRNAPQAAWDFNCSDDAFQREKPRLGSPRRGFSRHPADSHNPRRRIS